MKKLFEYRECRNSCRGPEACSPRVNSYLMEPSNSFHRVNPTLHCIRWKEYHRLHPQSITSSFDTTPKGKNPRGPLGRQPRATKLESGLSLQSLLFLDSLVRFLAWQGEGSSCRHLLASLTAPGSNATFNVGAEVGGHGVREGCV